MKSRTVNKKKKTAVRRQGTSVKYDEIVTDNVKTLIWSIRKNYCLLTIQTLMIL